VFCYVRLSSALFVARRTTVGLLLLVVPFAGHSCLCAIVALSVLAGFCGIMPHRSSTRCIPPFFCVSSECRIWICFAAVNSSEEAERGYQYVSHDFSRTISVFFFVFYTFAKYACCFASLLAPLLMYNARYGSGDLDFFYTRLLTST